MNVKAIIQARMLSSRLRGKTLMSVAGKPLLFRVIDNVKQLSFISDFLVATTSMEADQPIVAAVQSEGFKCTRGSSLNVLDRFVKSVEELDDADWVVRFTADNPICFNTIAEQLFERIKDSDFDYVAIAKLSHVFPEFIKVGALRKLHQISDDPRDLEHVTHFFRRKEGLNLFRVKLLPNDFEGLRPDLDKYLTIDNESDLKRLERLLELLEDKGKCDLQCVYSILEHDILNSLPGSIKVSLNGTLVGFGERTYIIAEIGQNHNGSIDLAKKLIDMAKRCGADAVKFQKRDISSELTKEAFYKPYDNPNSFGKTYGEHRLFLELSEEDHRELKLYSDTIGITYFSTPCDVPSVEVLESIDCPFYKVASRDLTNIPLLEKLGSLNKPVIISTGMASLEDIDNAINALKLPKNMVIITQCTSEYPCALENVNLKAMNTLREKYGLLVGLSDHTSGVVVSTAASVMGADVIEKHITLDRTMKGTDQPSSLEEAGLKKLIDYIRACEVAMGTDQKTVNSATQSAKEKLARSITSKIDIPKGTVLTEEMLCLKSPGTGLKWVEKDRLLGKIAKIGIKSDVTLREDDFE